MVYVLHTGCQWKALPKELLGSPSSVHGYFTRLMKAGFFLLPSDWEKKGSKRHILVDEHGVPLSLVVTEANRYDVTQLVEVLDNRIILQLEDTEQSFCANKGYTGDPAKKIVEAHGYITHVKGRGEEIKAKKECPVIVLAGGSLN